MYICLCNALTDRKLKQAIKDGGSATPSEVYAACGCRAHCGKCVRSVLGLLQDHLQGPAMLADAAD